MTGALRQTVALFLDAYRELNARKLFWISLVISVVVVASFAAAGLSERGITFLWWTFPNDHINSRQLSPDLLYKFIFASLAVPIWLAWVATILGLISTAGIVPEFIAGGAVELTLSKPIGRARLILTKYLTGLLFAALQVAVFTTACVIVIGIRGHAWEPRLFLAIPIVILFFSYLYCLCALIGLLTRSTIAALLLTMLCWFVMFGVHSTEATFLALSVRNELREQKIQGYIESYKAKLADNDAAIAALKPDDASKRTNFEDARRYNQAQLDNYQKKLESNRDSAVWITRAHTIAYAAKTVLPKTTETINLLDRFLLKSSDFEKLHPPDDTPAFGIVDDDVRISARAMAKRINEVLRARSLGWVLGTSIAFEGVVLLLLVRIFSRRDF